MTYKPFHLRIPSALKKTLGSEAKTARQSLNAYLLTLIETHPDRDIAKSVTKPSKKKKP